ncbi:MAG: hypothetical protein C4K60_06045 [Ideonella sp. MAG2]|nr:MAG: hypothetical protein C4K60_06045 [Ideonella sp. MAG2]
MMPTMQHSEITLAAIHDDGSGNVHALLRALVAEWRAQGHDVQGLVTRPGPPGAACSADMVLIDVATGEDYLISQNLGKEAQGCRADPAGFARASQVLRRAADTPAALAVSNRFGKLESLGEGFADELMALLSAGVPVLTVVSAQHREAWDAFTGGAPVLAADAHVVQAWWLSLQHAS